MSLFRSLSGLFSSAFESTPPIIVAASRSLSLSDAPSSSSAAKTTTSSTSTTASKSSSATTTSSKPEVKVSSTSSTSGGRDAIPEVDLSHLSVEERETIAAVLARANSADATRTDSDVDSDEKRSVTSAEEDAESSHDDDSQRGATDRQSPQLDVRDVTNTVSEAQHEVLPASAGELTQPGPEPTATSTSSGDSSPDLDTYAGVCSPDSAAKSRDGSQPEDGLGLTVGASPPPLPSPPSVTATLAAADDDDDEDDTAALVITDVAKYIDELGKQWRFDDYDEPEMKSGDVTRCVVGSSSGIETCTTSERLHPGEEESLPVSTPVTDSPTLPSATTTTSGLESSPPRSSTSVFAYSTTDCLPPYPAELDSIIQQLVTSQHGDDVTQNAHTVDVTDTCDVFEPATQSTTHRTEKMFGPQSQPQPTINTCTYVIQSTTTSTYVPATSTMTSTAEQPQAMTSRESMPVTSVPPSGARLSPRSSALQVTSTRRVSDPMFSAAYSPLDRPLLAPPLRRPHRAPPSARVATRFIGRQPPTSVVAGPETVSPSQTLPLPVGSRRAVSRSAEVLDKMEVGVSTAAAHSPFPGRARRRAATMSSYLDDDDEVDDDDDEYETREPATMKLVRLQTEINDRKRRLHQLIRRVNSLERTQPPDVDRWCPDVGRQVDVWDRSTGFPPPRRYAASPQRFPDFAYQPQRWTPATGGAYVGSHHPPPLSRQPPRLYRSLSYDTDRDPFLSRPMFDRLPPSIDPSYASPPCQRLPRNSPVARTYVDQRRRYEPPGPPVLLPPPLPMSAAPQKFGSPDWMTWSPHRSTVYSSQPVQSHMATPKCSPRHFDTCSVKSRSSASVHDPSTKRVLITPDPRQNGIGLRLVSMRRRTNANNQLITAAYVSAIAPGSAADRLHGELGEGDEVVELNGELLSGLGDEILQEIVRDAELHGGEVELVIRLQGRDESETPSTAGSLPSPYDNVQTPPRDGATSRGHHNGTLSVTVR